MGGSPEYRVAETTPDFLKKGVDKSLKVEYVISKGDMTLYNNMSCMKSTFSGHRMGKRPCPDGATYKTITWEEILCLI